MIVSSTLQGGRMKGGNGKKGGKGEEGGILYPPTWLANRYERVEDNLFQETLLWSKDIVHKMLKIYPQDELLDECFLVDDDYYMDDDYQEEEDYDDDYDDGRKKRKKRKCMSWDSARRKNTFFSDSDGTLGFF